VFLSKYFEELFDRAIRFPDLRQGIKTNGLLITEAWADRLLGNGVKLDISVDGVTRGTYEYVRRGASFARLVANLELLAAYKKKHAKAAGPMLHMTFVVMKSNVHEMELLPDFAHRYGIDVIQFTPLTFFTPEEQFAGENVQNDPALVAAVRELMPRLQEKAGALGITLDNALPFSKQQDFWEMKSGGREMKGARTYSCCHPWNSLFIDFGGVVMSQCSKCCNITLGNVTDNSLMAIWNNGVMQKYRRNIVRNRFRGTCNPHCNPNIMPEDPTYLDLF
jgi:MoaA/NifB/PqqE/SkfB family radical SAM enzyme